MIRAFFAVDLDGSARARAVRLAHRLRASPGGDAVRWVRPEALHVTLRFLGDIGSERVAPLARSVAAELGALSPLRLELGAARLFPDARRPRVVALAVGPREPLAGLAAAVERGVVAAGLPPEPRPFRAHLTLGRTRGRTALAAADAGAAGARWTVGEVVLYQSRLAPTGARYTPLERLPLGGQPFTPDSQRGEDE